ncbi:MAG: hypothetical protein JSV86_21980 [Gemmatimonadota bacterium]|nr:MAG: hypothetical protein JSV86_21980 [Gemmatimonadota bacterium]
MRRPTIIVASLGALLAVAAGVAASNVGPVALAVLVGCGLAAAAFIDLRITLLGIVPAMILLPELPLSIPLRTEDLLMAPLAAAWLALLALGRERWPSTPLNRPLLAVIAVELAAVLWGVYRGTAGFAPQLYSASFFFLKTVEVALLYFIAVSVMRTERDVRAFAYVFCASAAALGMWGALERGAVAASEAITGPAGYGGYSLLGLTLVVLLTTLVGLTLNERSRTVRGLLILAAIPVAYSLIFTLSRQSYVGAMAALAVLLWVQDRRLLAPALLLAFVLPLLVPGVVEERATSIVTGAPDPVTGGNPYATRVHALQIRLPEVLGQSPILGFGLAALPPGFLDNQYLLVLYYTGLIGLAAFLWLLWAATRASYRAVRSLEGWKKGLAVAWLAATLGLAIAGLAGSPFVAVRVRQVYWFLAALAVAAYRLSGASGRDESLPEAAGVVD